MKPPPWLVWSLVVLVTLVWVFNFIAGLVIPHYSPPEEVNLVFSTVVGGLLFASVRNGTPWLR